MVKAIDGGSYSGSADGAVVVEMTMHSPIRQSDPPSSDPASQQATAERTEVAAKGILRKLADESVRRLTGWLLGFDEAAGGGNPTIAPLLSFCYRQLGYPPEESGAAVDPINSTSLYRVAEIALNVMAKALLIASAVALVTTGLGTAIVLSIAAAGCYVGKVCANAAGSNILAAAEATARSAEAIQLANERSAKMVAELKESLAEAETKLGKEIENLKAQNDKLDDEIASLRTTAAIFTTQTGLLSTVSASMKTFSDKLTEGGDSIADELIDQIAELATQIESSKEVTKALEKQSSGQLSELGKLIKQLQDPVVLATKQRQLDKLKKVNESLKKRSDELKTQIRENKHLLKQVKTALADALDKLKVQNKTVGTHITGLDRLLKQLPTSHSPSTTSRLDSQSFDDAACPLTPSKDPDPAEEPGNSLPDNDALNDNGFVKVDKEE